MDRNPMLQNMNNPVAGLGIVPGKALLDDDTVAQRRENARNPLRNLYCYPGGEDKINHNIQVGDMLFGRRGQRDVEAMDGEPNELVTSSLSGLSLEDYNFSIRAAEDDHYFVGWAAGDEDMENPIDPTQVDARGGIGTVRVGTVSTINNGPYTFYPGDYARWRFPRLLAQGLFDGADPDNQRILLRARGGDEPTKFRPELVPFDPSDLNSTLAGVFSTMFSPTNDGGISDKPFVQTLPNADSLYGTELSTLQEEAAGYKYGLQGVVAAFLETCFRNGIIQYVMPANRVAQQHGANFAASARGVLSALNANNGVLLTEAMADAFLLNVGGENAIQDQAEARFVTSTGMSPYQAATLTPSGEEQEYARMRVHAIDLLAGGLSRSVDSHRSKIVGRCLSASASGDTLDLLLGHTL